MSFCFVHIEKAAGITLHEIFRNNFLFYNSLKPWYFKSNEFYLSKQSFIKLRNFCPLASCGFGGHTVREFEEYPLKNKPIHYITFLRNPIDRYISHYFHQKDKMGIRRTFEQYLEIPYFNNYIVNRISRKGKLEDAINRIDTFSFIGLVEDFDRSLIMLNNIVFHGGLDIRYELKNKGNINNSYQDIVKKYGDEIKLNNNLDIQLYEYVKEKVYPKYLHSFEEEIIEEKCNDLTEAKKGFKFNRLKLFVQKGYRYFYLYPIDYMVSYQKIKSSKKENLKVQ